MGHDDWRPAPLPPTVLEAAMGTADGPREATYGHPADHFAATGRMWGALLSARLGLRVPDVPPDLVALMFIADKSVRLCETPGHRDSLVDVCGYARCIEKVMERS